MQLKLSSTTLTIKSFLNVMPAKQKTFLNIFFPILEFEK